ncbi:hypothetical protein GCM10009827_095320 [Dactylosporangium maewongense]|uniref:Uncharacterized protein n=1 Tax=Dactylosporangium maewongense TaxID=634393 RepID=A0ABN2CKL1_9ACTN
MSAVRAVLRDPHWYRDAAGAGLQALAALLLTLAWAARDPDLPRVAWAAFAGVGLCGWLFLITAARSARLAATGAGELRGLLLVAMLLAQIGFVLRLSAREPVVPGLEWVVFMISALLFLAAYEVARRPVHQMLWVATVGVLLAGSVAAVVATPHGVLEPRLYWRQALPAAVLAAAVSGAVVLGCLWRRDRVMREAVRAHVVAVPPLAVYAFTRDPGAATLVCGATAGAVFGAGRVLWRSSWTATLRPIGTGVAAVAAVTTVLWLFDPWKVAVREPAPARDLVGVARETAGAVSLADVCGRAGELVLTLLVLVFALQVGLLATRAARPDAELPDRHAFQRVWAVALGGQVLASLLAPLLVGVLRLPAPPTLTTLPFAADGASFVVTFAALGLLFAAAQRPPAGAL